MTQDEIKMSRLEKCTFIKTCLKLYPVHHSNEVKYHYYCFELRLIHPANFCINLLKFNFKT